MVHRVDEFFLGASGIAKTQMKWCSGGASSRKKS